MPASVDLIRVAPERVRQVWPHAREFIRAAIERTGLSRFEDMEAAVLSGQHTLWLAWDGAVKAAATTEITDGVCVLVACGGRERARWLRLLEAIERYARLHGCSRMRIFGRKGWARVLPDYRTEFLILERAL